jgi:hypothetical protein
MGVQGLQITAKHKGLLTPNSAGVSLSTGEPTVIERLLAKTVTGERRVTLVSIPVR